MLADGGTIDGIPDPQWDYTLVIRAALEIHGKYVAEVDTRDAQALVDVHWAARQAGRLLGGRVKVDLSAPYGHAGSVVTATVRCAEADGRERLRAGLGLQKLLRSVQKAQGAVVRVSARVPQPRQVR